jgi:hypothetical protein
MDTLEENILHYYEEGYSTIAIGKLFNRNSQFVRRVLLKYGKTLRNHSEAQALAISTGRHPHPTKGMHLSDSHRDKISISLVRMYDIALSGRVAAL